MILIIDNYDSFSYNLYQLIGSLDPDVTVMRNNAATVEEVRAMNPETIVISPGPGRPEDAGICIDVVKELGPEIPILGICLGHQAICQAYGGSIVHARTLMHGKRSEIGVDRQDPLFSGLPDRISVARYHSLAAEPESLPDSLKVIAAADDGEIMAVRHREHPVCGMQFHPESVLTPDGRRMMANYLRSVGIGTEGSE